jgi:hypothetical protein
VAARRALDLGLIDRDTFRKFYLAYRAAERQKAEDTSSGGQFLPLQNMRVGSRFALTVARALAEGKLQYTEAYSLTGLYGKTFEKYVDYASSVA